MWCFCLFRACLFPLRTIYKVCIWWHTLPTCLMLFKANCIKGVCSMPILLCNKYSLAYFVSLVILILFPWKEKVPVSGVGDWLFVCFTSNHQPKPKALEVPNEGNERSSPSQATKQNKSVCVCVCMGGGRRLILLGSYIMRLSGVKANEWPLFIWAKPCGSPKDSLQAGLLVCCFFLPLINWLSRCRMLIMKCVQGRSELLPSSV